jgi:hypothetical protein
MSPLRKGLILFGMAASLSLGVCCLNVGWQLSQVVAAGRPTPRTLSVTELIAKGPGDNAHIELTDFSFGVPLVEKNGKVWECVWVPLYPPGEETRPSKRTVFLRAERIPDQTRLNVLYGQTSLKVMVTTSLADKSIWKVTPSATFRKAYPNLDSARVILLVEPHLELAGVTVLAGGQLFEPTVAQYTWGAGAGFLTLGLFCILLLFCRGKRGTEEAPAALPVDEHLRARLVVEDPLSVHWFSYWGGARVSAGRLLGALFLYGCGAAALLAAFATLDSAPPAAAGFGLFGLLLFGTALAQVFRAARVFLGKVSPIAVCYCGLRFTKRGQKRIALWSEIAHVQRVVRVIAICGAPLRFDSCTLYFHSGEVLRFFPATITEYTRFANAVMSLHEGGVKQFRVDKGPQLQGQTLALPLTGQSA